MTNERARLLENDSLTGAKWCRAHSDLVDAWLQQLFTDATGGDPAAFALVAVGGYGRSELCPESDIDVMLLHDKVATVATVADRIWYPVWDEGFHLGHRVSTLAEVLQLAGDDLDTATALLSARHVAGDARLTERLARAAHDNWQKRAKRWLAQLAARVDERHRHAGEVAFQLEPDLKDGRGGLRDVHSLRWADAAQPSMHGDDIEAVESAYAVILDIRVELQRTTHRPANILALQEQDAVAAALGDGDADALMARLAAAARTVAWTSDDTWRRVNATLRGPLKRIASRNRPLGNGLTLRDGEVVVDDGADFTAPGFALSVAVAAARHDASIERRSLDRLAAAQQPIEGTWPDTVRGAFVDLLARGAPAVRVIETLDQQSVWTGIVPEWEAVRARPQRNAYHRFTVDRHLLEATAIASRFAERVTRLDLLLMGTLFHDLGKGYPGDHTEIGIALIRDIATRMGYPPNDVDVLSRLVEHHLLLSEVATRRDLDDPEIITRVAATVGSIDLLHLLAALTEADSRATGPAAWGPWKAELVAQLVDRTAAVLAGDGPEALAPPAFPSQEHIAALASGAESVTVDDNMVTVMTGDRPGVFSRVAGALALHGLDVLAANAYSTEEGRALAEFRVHDPVRTETPWPKVLNDLHLTLAGRLALHARVEERARRYHKPSAATLAIAASVTFDNDASADATVIDVQAFDGIGVLYRITRAMAELDLDIRSARVTTLGTQVVDAFYVRDRTGAKITDTHFLDEIEHALLHALGSTFPS